MRFSNIVAITLASTAMAAPASFFADRLASIEAQLHTTPAGAPGARATTSAKSAAKTSALINPLSAKRSSTSKKSSSVASRTHSTSVVVPTSKVSTPVTSSAAASKSTATSATASAAGSDYTSQALSQHNIHRANHSAPALTYNTQLAGYAAQVAASCVFAHDLSEGGGGYGQNIAAYGSSDLTGFTPTVMLEVAISDQWYNGEVNLYLPSYYGKPTPDMTNFEAWGHFSQLVWKSSTGVGCATQLCPAGTIFPSYQSYYTVCNYQGAGNVGGLYGANVLPSLGEATYSP